MQSGIIISKNWF